MNSEIEHNQNLFVNKEPYDPRPNVISLGDGEDETYYICGVCKKEFSIMFGEDCSYNYPERCPHCDIKFILGDDMCISDDIWPDIEGIDTDKKCKYGCFYEKLCAKNDEDIKLCSKIKKNINLADNIDIVEYSDIENVKKYVDKILKLEKNAGVTFSLITDHTGDLICPVCGGTVFSKLSNSDSFICITCYRKHYVDNYGWYDLDYYYILDDMIEREKVRRLLHDSGNFDETKKLLNDHKKTSKTNNEYSNIGEVMLNMDTVTITNMNKLLGKLNQEDLLYDTKEDAIEYITNESKIYNFDFALDDDDKKDEYNAYINWNDERILNGFVRIDDDYNNGKWWIGFGYFYIGNG